MSAGEECGNNRSETRGELYPHIQRSRTLTVLNFIFMWHTLRTFRSALESRNSWGCQCSAPGPGAVECLRNSAASERKKYVSEKGPKLPGSPQCEKQASGWPLTDVMKGWC